MKKAISTLANLALALSVLLLLAVLVAPPLLGVSLEPVLGGSMEPFISTGALIAMVKVAPEEVQVGDVIGFKVEGIDTPVCHRVIELVDTEQGIGFRTKGDANEDPDAWVVKPENLLGKVVFDLPSVGYIAKFIKTPYGFASLLGLPAIIIVALELKSLFGTKPLRRRRPRLIRQKPSQFPAYLPIIIGLILIGVLWAMMAGNTQERTLGSFAQRSEEVNQPLYVSQRNMQNKGILPLVICLFSEDETVSFSENYFRLSPGRQKEIEISGEREAAVIKTGAFFPLLPQKTLYQLFTWDSRLAPLVAAAVWVFPLTVIAFVVLRAFSARPELVPRAKYLKGVLSHG